MAYSKYIHKLDEFPIPNSYALENKALGAIISEYGLMDEARKRLSDLSFEDESNRKLWNLLKKMDAEGEPLTMESVYAKCDSEHFRKFILEHIQASTPLEAFNAITALYDITLKRRAYIAGMNMIQAVQKENGADIALNTATNLIKDIEEELRDENTRSIGEAVTEFASMVETREKARKEGKVVRIPTSFPTLDRITYNGWTAGQLIVLAARPSIGKTAVMLQFARQSALAKVPSVVFSLEMTNNELVQRMMCSTQIVNGYDLANGVVDWSRFEQASGKFADLPLWLNDQCFTLDEISTKIRQRSRQGKCGIAFIDYLGLISYPNDNRSTYQQVTETTKRLKRLAKEAGIPIILLCQLNRELCKDGRAPELFDLRDSGSIEQDADIVMMLDRSLDPEKDYHDLKVYVRKNRQGELATLDIKADSCITNFSEIKPINTQTL